MLVTLYGGNDGLNTVVPYADPAYHDARPELAYSAEEVLHLDGQLGLNPAMTGLAALWKEKKLAIVRGVGYPKPDRSHFRSMDIWQTASPATPVTSGWVGRWLDAAGDDPLLAVNIGEVLPPLAVGARATAAALSVGKSTSSAMTAAVLKGFASADAADGPAARLVVASYAAHSAASRPSARYLGRRRRGRGRRGGQRPARRAGGAAGRRRPVHQGGRADAGVHRCRRRGSTPTRTRSSPRPPS